MRVGSDRIAAHRFRADAQNALGAAERRGVCGLGDDLDAGAADALNQQRRRLDRRAAIEADVARQHVGVEARLGHRAADHRVDRLGRDVGAFQRFTAGLDAKIDRRNQRQPAVVVDERRARALDDVGVVEHVANAPPTSLMRRSAVCGWRSLRPRLGGALVEKGAHARLRFAVALSGGGHQRFHQIADARIAVGDARQRLDHGEIGQRRVAGHRSASASALAKPRLRRPDIERSRLRAFVRR